MPESKYINIIKSVNNNQDNSIFSGKCYCKGKGAGAGAGSGAGTTSLDVTTRKKTNTDILIYYYNI